MGVRWPLTVEEREALRERWRAGDRSMWCTFGFEEAPASVEGRPDLRTVRLGRELRDLGGDEVEPDEARQLAVALMQAADHAEFGPGEWRDGVFHREEARTCSPPA